MANGKNGFDSVTLLDNGKKKVVFSRRDGRLYFYYGGLQLDNPHISDVFDLYRDTYEATKSDMIEDGLLNEVSLERD